MKKNKIILNFFLIILTYFLIKKTDFERFNIYYIISISLLITITYFKAKEIILFFKKKRDKSL
jgi:hypothetical protein